MRVLFIAFEFPPRAGIGVQRSLKFAKYLPEFGIDPIVITTDLEGCREAFPSSPMDENLLDDLPKGIVVKRIPFTRKKKINQGRIREWARIYFSCVEDIGKIWLPKLEKALPEIIKTHKPEAIYVSCPPFSMGLMGKYLAEKYKLPLILDYRDAWSQWNISPYGTPLHYWLTCKMEFKCLDAATHIICTSDQTRADFLRMHSNIPSEKITVITNGYDKEVENWDFQPAASQEVFKIGYVGSFYYSPKARESMMMPWWKKRPNRMIQYTPRKEDWLYRSPYFFFHAVSVLLERRPELRKRLKIIFVGNKPGWIDAQINQFSLNDIVSFSGYLSHKEAIGFQEDCDALLLTSSKVIGGKDYSIAGKTFEYLSVKKPILGFVTEGAQKELLERSGVAVICDPDNPEKSAEKLESLITGKIELEPDVSFLKRLHRKDLSRNMADIFREVVKTNNNK